MRSFVLLKPVLIRDAEAGENAELFLVAAVATLLSIRAVLHLTSFPRLGSGSLHIAHMLWGGLLMGAALAVLFSTLNRQARPFAAVLGGIGFGFFIDELGKFITLDNDYFYRPTVAIIYLLFATMFLAYRAIERRALNDAENLANALSLMQDMVIGDLDVEEKRRAAAFLDRCSLDDPRVAPLRELQARLVAVPVPRPGLYRRLHGRLGRLYERVVEMPLFGRALVLFFAIQALVAVTMAMITATALWRDWRGVPVGPHIPESAAQWGRLLGSLASGALVVRGTLLLRRSRTRAYESFRRATLVAVFVTQFFVFYLRQFAGLAGLAFHLLVLAALQGLRGLERRRLTPLDR